MCDLLKFVKNLSNRRLRRKRKKNNSFHALLQCVQLRQIDRANSELCNLNMRNTLKLTDSLICHELLQYLINSHVSKNINDCGQ